MFLFGPLHVLALYAWKRIAGIIEFDEGVYEEIQRRAALVPPAQRQAAIDTMVHDRLTIGKEVMLRKQAEKKAAKKSIWSYWLVCLMLAWVIWFVYECAK